MITFCKLLPNNSIFLMKMELKTPLWRFDVVYLDLFFCSIRSVFYNLITSELTESSQLLPCSIVCQSSVHLMRQEGEPLCGHVRSRRPEETEECYKWRSEQDGGRPGGTSQLYYYHTTLSLSSQLYYYHTTLSLSSQLYYYHTTLTLSSQLY